MIDREKEDLIRVTEVPALIHTLTGKKISIHTVYRWIRTGLNTARLDTHFIGGVQMTSKEALERFDEEVSNMRRRRRKRAEPIPSQKHVKAASAEAIKRLSL